MFADRRRRARAVEAAARDRDDDALVAGQAFDALRRYLNVLPATRMRSIQALSWLGMVKLYMGAPITTMSAARNSSSTA